MDILTKLQKAISDRDTAQEMVKEAEKVIKEVTATLRRDYPEIYHLFQHNGVVTANKEQSHKKIVRIDRSVWQPEVLQLMKEIRVPIEARTYANRAKISHNIALTRLEALGKSGDIVATRMGSNHVVFSLKA